MENFEQGKIYVFSNTLHLVEKYSTFIGQTIGAAAGDFLKENDLRVTINVFTLQPDDRQFFNTSISDQYGLIVMQKAADLFESIERAAYSFQEALVTREIQESLEHSLLQLEAESDELIVEHTIFLEGLEVPRDDLDTPILSVPTMTRKEAWEIFLDSDEPFFIYLDAEKLTLQILSVDL